MVHSHVFGTDEEKPTCVRCRNAGIDCQGYHSLNIIQDKHVKKLEAGPSTSTLRPETEPEHEEEGAIEEGKNPRKRSRQNPDSNTGTVIDESEPESKRQALAGSSVEKAREAIDTQQDLALNRPSLMELDIKGFKETIYYTFLIHNLLRHLDIGRKSLLPAWDLDDISGTTKDCTIALALAFYGRFHHQEDVSRQGAVCYGMALLELTQDLNDKHTSRSVSVLLSTIALFLYEVNCHFRHSPASHLSNLLRSPIRIQDMKSTLFF